MHCDTGNGLRVYGMTAVNYKFPLLFFFLKDSKFITYSSSIPTAACHNDDYDRLTLCNVIYIYL